MRKIFKLSGLIFSFIIGLSMLLGAQPVFAAAMSATLEMSELTGLTEITAARPLTPDNDGTDDWISVNVNAGAEGDIRIIVDTDRDGIYEPITDWSTINWSDPANANYAGKYDYSMQMHTWAGNTQSLQWQGKDNTWQNVLSGVSYNIKVEFDDDSNGTFDDDDAADVIRSVYIATAGISGTVTDSATSLPIQGVKVEAGSMSSWGSAYTAADGTYTISGLRAGSYHMQTQKNGYASKWLDNVTVTAGATTSGKDFALNAAKNITGTISLKDSNNNPVTFSTYTDRWGGVHDRLYIMINAWNPTGPGSGWAQAEILNGNSSVNYTLSVDPGTYNVRAEAEGYASELSQSVVVGNSGASLDINLSKATRVYGTVHLPAASASNLNINVSAWTSNYGGQTWGGGQIDIAQDADDGNFELRGVLPGTYTVRIEVVDMTNWMPVYAPKTITGVVVALGTDKDLGTQTMSAGASIAGTVTIVGAHSPQTIWVNGWSPSSSGGFGKQVNFAGGAGNETQPYTISGLESSGTLTYNINAWLQNYETSPRNLEVTITDGVITRRLADGSVVDNANITLTGYSGIIRGTVSGFTNYANVIVSVDQPGSWGNSVSKVAQLGADGTYSITGLGTGDYIVKANQYIFKNTANIPPTDSDVTAYLAGAPGVTKTPDGNFGTAMDRALVANGSPTTVNLALTAGLSISGTIRLATSVTTKGWALSDLAGKQAQCFPIQMQMMGMMSEFYWGAVAADGTYIIQGLPAGTYIVEPPLDLGNIDANGKKTAGDNAFYGMNSDFSRDVAYTSQTVTLSASNATGVDFTLADGYDISGTVTLPAVPSNEWYWIGDLGLDTMGGNMSGMGMGLPVQGYHFTAEGQPGVPHPAGFTTTYNYTIRHVIPGDYTLRFWSDKYLSASQEITVSNANLTNVNLVLSKGANIVGQLVDANTGTAVTSEDGVMVRCEARPWVEGSWRGTFMSFGNDTDHSYIEKQGDSSPGKFYLKNLPAGNYIVTASTNEGNMGMYMNSGKKSKNYASQTIAGITVSDSNVTNNQSVDIGTIKLKEGIELSGRVYQDTNSNGSYDPGEGLANIPVEAEPADMRLGGRMKQVWTAADGTYTVSGVNPDIQWWEVTAALRPYWNERFMARVSYGEQSKLVDINTVNNRKDINFALNSATITFTGTISKAATDPNNDIPFALPPFEEGKMEGGKANNIPAVLILLQKVGEVYDDPMDGIQEISALSNTNTTTFTIRDLEQDKYMIRVFCPGFDTYTAEVDASAVASNGTLDVGTIALQKGGTVSGTVRLSDGSKPSMNDIQTVVAMKTNFSSMVFGKLIYNSSTREVSSYEIKGIMPDTVYYLVFVAAEGAEIHVINETSSAWTLVSAGPPAVYTYNAVINPGVPSFELVAKKVADTNADGIADFQLSIMSSHVLVDADSADALNLLTLTTGSGTLRGNVASVSETGAAVYYELTDSKDKIEAVYSPASGEASFTITVASHRASKTGEDSSDTQGTAAFTVYTANSYTNMGKINTVNGGSTNMAQFGDATQTYFPPGAIDEADNDGSSQLTIVTTDKDTAFDELGNPLFDPAAYPEGHSFVLPAGAASDIYAFSLSSGDDFSSSGESTIGLKCDVNYDSETANVFSYDTTTGYWRVENENRSINPVSSLIEVNVNHFSDYAVINSNPVAPASITVTPGDGKNVITWTDGTASSGMNADVQSNNDGGYNVYRSTTSGSFTGCPINDPSCAHGQVNLIPVSQKTYTDTTAVNGVKYYYVVRQVKGFQSEESGKSPEGEGTPASSSSSYTKKRDWYSCAIATASFGSPDNENVVILRKFRDQYLLKNSFGREFVNMYYRFSPPIADYIRDKEGLKAAARVILKPIVSCAKELVDKER